MTDEIDRQMSRQLSRDVEDFYDDREKEAKDYFFKGDNVTNYDQK
jgi:hypothetical protein